RSAPGWWAITSRRTSAGPPASGYGRAGWRRRSASSRRGPTPRRALHASPISKGSSTSVHGLILAGGEGSRLATAGEGSLPKPLVQVAGRPQIVRLLETFEALGCTS